VMEFADGGDLDQFVKGYAKRRAQIDERRVMSLFVQISLAMKHIHDRKILHRDLKSQNVFLTSAGLCKLGDFGVSRVLSKTGELAKTQIGTPYYMSPEIMNNQKYNSKTDIWSLGCILYELMCLRLPFGGQSMKHLIMNIINATPTPPSSTYSSDLRSLVRDLLTKSPNIRPGINSVLARPIVRDRISSFLDDTKRASEFSHTVLHGMDVLKAPQNAPAAQVASVPPARVIRPESPRHTPVPSGSEVNTVCCVTCFIDWQPLQYILNRFEICSLSVRNRFEICSLSVRNRFEICSLSVRYLFEICSLSVRNRFETCSLSVRNRFEICSLSVRNRFETCSLSVRNRSAICSQSL
jgi:serine/threonine protein kinase